MHTGSAVVCDSGASAVWHGAAGTGREGAGARRRLARREAPGRHRGARRLASGSRHRRPRRLGAPVAGPARADRGARREGARGPDPSSAGHPVSRLHAHGQPRAVRERDVRAARPPARARAGGVRGGQGALPRCHRRHRVGHHGGVVVDGARAPGRAEGAGRPARHRRAHRRSVLGADRAFARVDVVPAGRPARQGVAACAAKAGARGRTPGARAVRGPRRLRMDGVRAARGPAQQLEPVDQLERAGRDAARRTGSRQAGLAHAQGPAQPRRVPRALSDRRRVRRGARPTGGARAPACSSRSNCCSRPRRAASTTSRTRSSPTSAGSSTGPASPTAGSSTSATAARA